MKKALIIIITLVCLLLPFTAKAFKAKALRVVDGDTIVVEHDGKQLKLRLMCVQSPDPGEPGGEEAAQALRELIEEEGHTLRVEAQGKDHKGRTLAWVYHPAFANLSYQIVRLGHARWLRKECPDEETLKGLEKGAQEARSGIWK